ncbi:MAG: RNA ligase [Planctomycetota bacterium]
MPGNVYAIDDMRRRVADGRLREVPDPDGSGLCIFDYTQQCAWDRAWDDFTLAARGLVLAPDGRVVARPFPKFFNLGEPDVRLPDGHSELFEKYDGSLIIVFHDGRRWRCNTRGSWDSEQAIAARAWLDPWIARDFGAAAVPAPGGHTLLFEYVSPGNRVVVPYRDTACVLLGVIDSATGIEWSEWRAWGHAQGLPLAASHGVRDVAAVDMSGGSGTREGYVARWPDGYRLKLKFADYLHLHRIVTGTSPRRVWEQLRDGAPPLPLEQLPDEFARWYVQFRDGLQQRYAELHAEVDALWLATPELPDRKSRALHWRSAEPWALKCLFARLDGKPYDEIIWRRVRPGPE